MAGVRAVVLYTGAGGPGRLEWLARAGPPDCLFRPVAAEILPLADAILVDLPAISGGVGCEFPPELTIPYESKRPGQLWFIARPLSYRSMPATDSAAPSNRSSSHMHTQISTDSNTGGRCGGPELWSQIDGRLSFPAVIGGRAWSQV
jgi:hypothetical protein